MKNNFTILNYSELLKYFKKTHNFVLFKEYENSNEDNIILLRHDIDFSLKHALTIAELESSLGIKSTYFLLFSSPFYNILDSENIEIAKKLISLGHEVGLHYDVNVFLQGNAKDPNPLFHAQIEMLSVLIDMPVTSIAMHNPSISGEDLFRNTEYINVYDKSFVKDIAYFSDSCMAWRNNFIDHLENNTFPKKFQFLIHPILWTEKELDRYVKLDEFLQSKNEENNKEIEFTKNLWRNHSGVIEHEQRIHGIPLK